MQVRTAAGLPPPYVGDENALDRHDAKQVGLRLPDPASHAGALRETGQATSHSEV